MKSKHYKPFVKGTSSNFKNEQKNVLDTNGKFEKRKDPRGVQCHECSGYGHIKSECANTLKKQKGF